MTCKQCVHHEKFHDEATDPQPPTPIQHNVTIIGVIRGVTGWFRTGYDENTKTIIPLEKMG